MNNNEQKYTAQQCIACKSFLILYFRLLVYLSSRDNAKKSQMEEIILNVMYMNFNI